MSTTSANAIIASLIARQWRSVGDWVESKEWYKTLLTIGSKLAGHTVHNAVNGWIPERSCFAVWFWGFPHVLRRGR